MIPTMPEFTPPGNPSFDNVCRFLAESFSADFATWLIGESIELTQLSPSELSLSGCIHF
ncbi:hypothetical protein H6G54_30060 [Anabaena cylindrica FACHB-243]|uniref:hypothetical protein n=2 Tax=Anabaena TaxID=1163 RepID=UPI001687C16C|nr:MULTISPECIES: hypothetical protein [Anabaena]MBD2421843.1 hypothetical protein [Anabaena cylindrica FACHB-243]MBY5284894.1 hypothetical protein [Anabaena sp. CCAP 1446/1C]MBY5308739.1 hypothetical protein [Anabaena sp. CCAP 1446/1C]